jgi:hypothetical protein
MHDHAISDDEHVDLRIHFVPVHVARMTRVLVSVDNSHDRLWKGSLPVRHRHFPAQTSACSAAVPNKGQCLHESRFNLNLSKALLHGQKKVV